MSQKAVMGVTRRRAGIPHLWSGRSTSAPVSQEGFGSTNHQRLGETEPSMVFIGCDSHPRVPANCDGRHQDRRSEGAPALSASPNARPVLHGNQKSEESRSVTAGLRLLCSIPDYSRRESFAKEPSLRIFFLARFRARACFTRRLSPGFR